jgi:hypothetical protein
VPHWASRDHDRDRARDRDSDSVHDRDSDSDSDRDSDRDSDNDRDRDQDHDSDRDSDQDHDRDHDRALDWRMKCLIGLPQHSALLVELTALAVAFLQELRHLILELLVAGHEEEVLILERHDGAGERVPELAWAGLFDDV